jgi:hypothetical protein
MKLREKDYIRRKESHLKAIKNRWSISFFYLEVVASVLWRVCKPLHSVEFR